MLSIRILRGVLCLALACCLVQLGPSVRTARAALVTTEEAVARDTGRDRIRLFLERVEVRDQLRALGVVPGEASARVSSLGDGEVAAIAGRLDDLPAGGDTLSSVLLLLAVLFLILILLDYAGVTDLFPWVNKPARR